jgi:DNA-binding transcriptional LysR family regulator
MPRPLNLRQIDAFKAVIDYGTISRAALVLNISQPAMSKLVAHLEFDSGVRLFNRVKGRLTPTEQGLRLYEEVGRIFAGVRQVESALEAIRREEQGRLAIGILPALANSFLARAATDFIKENSVYCTVQSLTTQLIVEWLIARKLDVGVVSATTHSPDVSLEPLMEQPLVCIMPLDHPLTAKRQIEPQDLDHVPFVAFDNAVYVFHLITEVFESYRVAPQIVLSAINAVTICEFVATGLGVSLVHPLMVCGLEARLAVRPFAPDILYGFQLCRSVDSRNAHIVEAFVEELRKKSLEISQAILAHR